jgi:Flp pilus assembly protein TadD
LLILAAVALHVLFRDRRRLRGRAAAGGFLCFATAAVAANLPFSHFSQRHDFESEMYYLSGRVLISHGQSDRGMRWLEKAIEIDPTNAQAHNSLGVNLAKEGRLEDAALHFREALRIRPGDMPATTNLAWVLELERERTAR